MLFIHLFDATSESDQLCSSIFFQSWLRLWFLLLSPSFDILIVASLLPVTRWFTFLRFLFRRPLERLERLQPPGLSRWIQWWWTASRKFGVDCRRWRIADGSNVRQRTGRARKRLIVDGSNVGWWFHVSSGGTATAATVSASNSRAPVGATTGKWRTIVVIDLQAVFLLLDLGAQNRGRHMGYWIMEADS